METFEMSDENFKKVILELLISYKADAQILKEIILHQLANGDEEKHSGLQQLFESRKVVLFQTMKEHIFANYGSLDLDNIFQKDNPD